MANIAPKRIDLFEPVKTRIVGCLHLVLLSLIFHNHSESKWGRNLERRKDLMNLVWLQL